MTESGASTDDAAPLTRRALRAAREREAARTLATRAARPAAEAAHPPIFRPRLRPAARVRHAPVPLLGRPAPAGPRHAQRPPRHGLSAGVAAAGLALVVLVTGGIASATPAHRTVAASSDLAQHDLADAPMSVTVVVPTPTATDSARRRAPVLTGEQAPPAPRPCDDPGFTAALARGDDVAAIAAAGGGELFREAVAGGTAPCVSMTDPARLWTVVDKLRPLQPADYTPSPLKLPDGVRNVEGSGLRADAADALTALTQAAASAGVGTIALESGYRSYQTQQGSYSRQVVLRGVAGADLVSARPGYSEHQTGLTGDLVACAATCGTLDDLAASAQGAWLREHAWEYGWIVRYEDGQTAITGYAPEPWHLRYIGVDLARAYHDGGFHTLEQFFGLPAAPAYAS